MKPIDKQEFEPLETPPARREFTPFALAYRFQRALKWAFDPCFDLNGLNGRLRRDAGIDELELERIRLAKAPLIR